MKASTSGMDVRSSPAKPLRHATGDNQLLGAMAAAHAAIAIGVEYRADAFFLGRVDEGAGVHDHDVGLVRVRCQRHSRLVQMARHDFRIDEVLGAAERNQPDFNRRRFVGGCSAFRDRSAFRYGRGRAHWTWDWTVKVSGAVPVAVGSVVHAIELDVDGGGNADIDRKFVAGKTDRLAAAQDGRITGLSVSAESRLVTRTNESCDAVKMRGFVGIGVCVLRGGDRRQRGFHRRHAARRPLRVGKFRRCVGRYHRWHVWRRGVIQSNHRWRRIGGRGVVRHGRQLGGIHGKRARGGSGRVGWRLSAVGRWS